MAAATATSGEGSETTTLPPSNALLPPLLPQPQDLAPSPASAASIDPAALVAGAVASAAASASSAAGEVVRWAKRSRAAAASAFSELYGAATIAAGEASLEGKAKAEWLTSQWAAGEAVVFGTIKEGVITAMIHPVSSLSVATAAGIVLFKRPRSLLIHRLRRMFVSNEVLLSSANHEVNDLKQSVDLVSKESQKLLDRIKAAERKAEKGFNALKLEGFVIRKALGDASRFEKEASGLKLLLNDLPPAQASVIESQINSLASEVKAEKKALNAALLKIVNHGIPI